MSRSRASADALSLNSSHSRSTDDGSSKKPPLWPGATVSAVPAFVTRLAVPGAVGVPARLVTSGARMRLLVDAAEPLVRDVSVGLGRGQGNVPQQLLHGPQVGASLQQVGRIAVPQGVRTGPSRC